MFSSARETYNFFGNENIEKFMLKSINSRKLHHAYLFTGAKGLGKATFAYRVSKYILSNSLQDNMNVDRSEKVDKLIRKNSHPDFMVLSKDIDNEKSVIEINQVRECISFFNHTPILGRYKICIIDSLDDMNTNGANALLKILEEPPDNTTLILVTDYKDLILPTIISRCQFLGVPRFSDSFIQNWLRTKNIDEDNIILISGLSGGNIHQARFLVEKPLEDLKKQINEMITSLLNKNPELWYSFINTYSRMALSKPDSFKFFFGLIAIWFRSVYRKKMKISDPLHKTELVKNINYFNSKYINAKLLDIVLEIEDVIIGIKQNLYMPLRLTNMILNIQKLLK